MPHDSQQITRLLRNARDGDDVATERLMELVHAELKQIAQRQMRAENREQTLQATALVNEAYLQMFSGEGRSWENRKHFFAYAASVMRHVLVQYARRRNALKRGGGQLQVTLTGISQEQSSADLIALDEALDNLAKLDERKSRLIELRFFGGLTIEELCEQLDLAPSTIHKELKSARGWLYNELSRPT